MRARDRKLHALVLADGPREHDTLLRVLRRALDEPAAVADAFGRDQNPLGIEAVDQIPEALAFFADERRRWNLQVVEKQLRRRVIHHRPNRADGQAVANRLAQIDEED